LDRRINQNTTTSFPKGEEKDHPRERGSGGGKGTTIKGPIWRTGYTFHEGDGANRDEKPRTRRGQISKKPDEGSRLSGQKAKHSRAEGQESHCGIMSRELDNHRTKGKFCRSRKKKKGAQGLGGHGQKKPTLGSSGRGGKNFKKDKKTSCERHR